VSFDAMKRIRDAAEHAVRSDKYATICREVSAEHGVTLEPFRSIYRHTRLDSPALKGGALILGKPRGDVDDTASVKSSASLPIMPCTIDGTPDVQDAWIQAAITALGRLFARSEWDGVKFNMVGFDADEPSPFENVVLQTGLVELSADIIEAPY
jgi:hypothetical protein